MNAYKCDICGKLYERGAHLVVEVEQQKLKCDLVYISGNCVDTCPDCLKALQKTIIERKNQNVQ